MWALPQPLAVELGRGPSARGTRQAPSLVHWAPSKRLGVAHIFLDEARVVTASNYLFFWWGRTFVFVGVFVPLLGSFEIIIFVGRPEHPNPRAPIRIQWSLPKAGERGFPTGRICRAMSWRSWTCRSGFARGSYWAWNGLQTRSKYPDHAAGPESHPKRPAKWVLRRQRVLYTISCNMNNRNQKLGLTQMDGLLLGSVFMCRVVRVFPQFCPAGLMDSPSKQLDPIETSFSQVLCGFRVFGSLCVPDCFAPQNLEVLVV